MFAAPRVLVIDDKETHLRAIIEVFRQLGSPCLGVHYNPAGALDRNHFRGIRCLLVDLHLVDSGATTDPTQHYALIASLLENNIHEDGGPYVLIVWTEHAQLRQGLTDYLNANIDPQKPYSRPVAVLALDKTQYINVATGGPISDAAATALRDCVEAEINSVPQLRALLDWEGDLLAAAGATLSTLASLVPAAERTTTAFPAALDVVLSRLAREAVGRGNVAADPRAAISSALAPILADRIVNQAASAQASQLWSQAVTRLTGQLPQLTAEESGRINRMLHLAVPGPEVIRSTDWGAVVQFPADRWNNASLQSLFGVTEGQIYGDEFKIAPADRPNCRPCLVRVGAACDHAQGRRGPLTYLLALELPSGIQRQPLPDGTPSISPASEWATPVLTLDGVGGAFTLHVNCRFPITLPAAQAAQWVVRYRLREQLLMTLISHVNVYLSRPGILRV
jgi:hypothetical protein